MKIERNFESEVVCCDCKQFDAVFILNGGENCYCCGNEIKLCDKCFKKLIKNAKIELSRYRETSNEA